MPISYSTIAYDDYLNIYFKYNKLCYYLTLKYNKIFSIISNNNYNIYGNMYRCTKVSNLLDITHETDQFHYLKYMYQDHDFLCISICDYFFTSIIDKMSENFL